MNTLNLWSSSLPTERFSSLVTTDKQLYKPGDIIYYRIVLLNIFSGKLIASEALKYNTCTVNIKSSLGDIILNTEAEQKEEIYHGQWKIPQSQTGGEFTIEISHTQEFFGPAERKVTISSFRNPKVKSKVVFSSNGYSAGEQVHAMVTIERAEGGSYTNKAMLTFIARVDGTECYKSEPQPFQNPALGKAEVKFTLPSSISSGEGTLTIVVNDSGEIETVSKSIPITLQSVKIVLFPEGSGNIICNVPVTVYFEAYSPISGDIMDVQGELVNLKTGASVTTFKTVHEGRGKFSFTPESQATYAMKVVEPRGVQTVLYADDPANPSYESTSFPVAKQGYTLAAAQPVFKTGESATITVLRSELGPQQVFHLTLRQKTSTVYSTTFTMEAGVRTFTQQIPNLKANGVLVATLYTATGHLTAVAERLLFATSDENSLVVSVDSNRKKFTPGEKVELVVATSNKKGDPVDAIVGLAVTDDSVLQMVERRKQAPRIEAMYYLESEVDHLEDAHIYLNAGDQRATEALDLLLGTQGWRRFAYELAMYSVIGSEKKQKLMKLLAISEEYFSNQQSDEEGWEEECEDLCVDEDDDDDDDNEDEDGGFMDEESANMLVKEDTDAEKKALPASEAPVTRVRPASSKKEQQPKQRSNFVDTVYWNPYLKTVNGRASCSFQLNDSITSFRAVVDGFSQTGLLGSSETFVISSTKSFHVDAKLPTSCIDGDQLQIPVTITNNSAKKLEGTVKISLSSNNTISLLHTLPFSVDAETKAVVYAPLNVGSELAGRPVSVIAEASADVPGGKTFPFNDKVSRVLHIDYAGVPEAFNFSQHISARKIQSVSFTIPEERVAAYPIDATFKTFTSSTSTITKAVESLICQPCGCFEQTSSIVYPMVMARRIFQQCIAEVDPALIRKTDDFIADGYRRLLRYECKSGGYELFGGEPGDAVLTALGVLEFTDMQEFYPVNQEMLARTTRWLSSMHKNGVFVESEGYFTPPDHICTAYIVWALSSAKMPYSSLESSVNYLMEKLDTDRSDSYFVGLVACSLLNFGMREQAASLLKLLASYQQKDGCVANAKSSVMGSYGNSLGIEATSLAAMAWNKYGGAYLTNADTAIRWLFGMCRNGYFGSTQGTVLALKAITDHATSSKITGSVVAMVDGETVAKMELGTSKPGEPVEVNKLLSLAPGTHTLNVTSMIDSDNSVPVTAELRYRVNKFDSAEAVQNSQIQFTATLKTDNVKQGEATEISVDLKNLSYSQKAMTVAIVGLPSGLEARLEKLQELVKAKKIAAFELKEKSIVLYWRSLSPHQQVSLMIDAVAAVPGVYTGAASCAYLYYYDEQKQWQQGMKCTISK